MAKTRTGIQQIEPWLKMLWEQGGTDLLLTAGAPPLLRIDGELRRVDGEEPLTDAGTERIASGLLADGQFEEFKSRREYDFSFTFDDTRIRGNAFHQRDCVAIALRMIPRYIPPMDEIGVPEVVREFATRKQGLVLVTGPTGSGKSTTLASVIDWINTNRAVHIVTVEDPIEYVHEHKQSAVNQREVGEDTESFARALRSALREDPDVLLVGEMRDLESIAFTLTLAETGHLVFATLHTNDVAQAMDRLVDVFPPERQSQIRLQLANALTGVVHQRLVNRIGGGLVAAFEVMVANGAVRNLVREGKSNQLRNVVATHVSEGMRTLETHLTELVIAGVIDEETALSVSLLPKDIHRQLGEHRAAQAELTAKESRRGMRRR